MPSIQHFLLIKSPCHAVYEAITGQQGLSSWWTTNCIAKPELGFVNEFNFSTDYHNEMKITRLENDRMVSWKCIRGDKEWIGTNLSFELREKNGYTELLFTHADWAAQTIFFASCNFNWGRFMMSLKNYCETGKGNPYKE